MKNEPITEKQITDFIDKNMRNAFFQGNVRDIRELFYDPCFATFVLSDGTLLTPERTFETHQSFEKETWVASKGFHVIEICRDPRRVRSKIHLEWTGTDKRTSKPFLISHIARYIFGRKENGCLGIVSFQELSRHYLGGTTNPDSETYEDGAENASSRS